MTGALSVVTELMSLAREHEHSYNLLVQNEHCWSTALSEKLKAENRKVEAALEFLLWFGAVSSMPAEPKPWDELQAKLAKEQEEKEKSNGQ